MIAMLLLVGLRAGFQDEEIARWIEQLGSDDLSQREEAQNQLVKLGGKAVPALEEAARSSDSEIASRAVQAIRLIRKAERRAILLRSLNPQLLRARPAILYEATSESAGTWQKLLADLCGKRLDSVRDELERCKRKYVDVTRRDFLAILGSYVSGTWRDDTVEGILYGIAGHMGVRLTPELLKRKEGFVAQGKKVFRDCIDAETIGGRFGGRIGTNPLYTLAKGDAGRWSEWAKAALGTDREKAVAALVELLQHEKESVRLDSIDRLIQWEAEETEKNLVVLLEDPSPKVLEKVLRAVRSLALEGAEPEILRCLANKGPISKVDLFSCLSELGLPSSVPAFEKALTDEDPDVRKLALLGLARSEASDREPQILPLLEDANGAVRLEALRTLATLTGAKHAEKVRPWLSDLVLLESALEILGCMRDIESLPKILPRMDDIEPQIRAGAIHAVARIHPDSILSAWETIDDHAVTTEILWELNRAAFPDLWEKAQRTKLARRKYRGTVAEIASAWSQESAVTIEGLESEKTCRRVYLRPSTCSLLDALPLLAPAGSVCRFVGPSRAQFVPLEEARRQWTHWIAKRRK